MVCNWVASQKMEKKGMRNASSFPPLNLLVKWAAPPLLRQGSICTERPRCYTSWHSCLWQCNGGKLAPSPCGLLLWCFLTYTATRQFSGILSACLKCYSHEFCLHNFRNFTWRTLLIPIFLLKSDPFFKVLSSKFHELLSPPAPRNHF